MWRVVKTIFAGIAKVLAYIFITLGLWMPALYTIAYLTVVGISPRLSMHGATLAVYCVGLGVFAVGGFALAVWRYYRRKEKEASEPVAEPEKKEKKKKRNKEEEKEESKSAPVAENVQAPPYGYYPYYPPYPQYPPQYPPQYSQQDHARQYSEPYREAPKADNSDLERKYFSDSSYARQATPPQPEQPTVPQEYARTASKTGDLGSYSSSAELGADELWRRLTGAEVPDEQPLVFRTRKDANLFVYEYSDRYQYWRQTKAGMVLESTEFKKPEGIGDDSVRGAYNKRR